MGKNNNLNQITDILSKYQTEVNEALAKSIKETAKEGVDDLKKKEFAELPTYTDRRKKGYSKGWTSSREAKGKFKNAEVIHNKTDYRLTHLLENGHMKRDGTGRTRAFPHIEPTRKILEKEVIKITEENLNKI